MPWCPKCRVEYEPGFKTCSDCETELVDELEPINNSVEEYDKEAYLTSASNNIEAEVIEALLKSNGIPVLKKFREAGGYLEIYMGGSNFGVDLYVPSKLLETARDIISSTPEMVEENDQIDSYEKESEEAEFNKLAENNKKKRMILNWIIILVFFPGLIFIALGALNTLLNWIFKLF